MIKQNRNLLILLITASLLKIFYPFLIAFIPKVIVENMDEPVLLIQFLMGSGIVVILLQAAISFCDSMKDHAYAVFRFCFSASSIERRCWCPMISCHRSSFRMIINFRFSLWTILKMDCKPRWSTFLSCLQM